MTNFLALLNSNLTNTEVADALLSIAAEGDVDYENFHEVAEALSRVHDEMERQDERWGVQNHAFIELRFSEGPSIEEIRDYFAIKAQDERDSNDIRQAIGATDWRGVLLEEVYEALAEDDPSLAVAELVQVAAVAVQAALSIGRVGLLAGQ